MDKLTTHTLPDGREILFVEVPEGTSGYKLGDSCIYFDIKHGLDNELIALPDDCDYTIIGVSDQMSEEECAGVVQSLPDPFSSSGHRNFKDYTKTYSVTSDRYILLRAKESFASLLRSLGLDTTKRYCLLEKMKS